VFNLGHTQNSPDSSYMLKRQTAFDLQQLLQAYGRGVGERKASRDSQGMHLIRHAQHSVKHCVVERPGASSAFSLSRPFDATRAAAPVALTLASLGVGRARATARDGAMTSRTHEAMAPTPSAPTGIA
jgi:hypothetical protein